MEVAKPVVIPPLCNKVEVNIIYLDCVIAAAEFKQ
jgi:hypothetical protein